MEIFMEQLKVMSAAVHATFAGPAAVPRLAQFDGALAALESWIAALYDEGERMEGYK